MLRIIEVGIGLALVFTLVALICSILNEWLSAVLEKRGKLLWEGIQNLLDPQLRDDLCNHKLIQGLVRESTWFDKLTKLIFRKTGRPKPSYVPTDTFVTTLIDVLGARAFSDTALNTAAPVAAGHTPTTPDGLQDVIKKANIPADLQQALLALVQDAGIDLEKAKKNIGDWFDAGMDRVTGWYKRWTQIALMVLSLVVACVLGVDSIVIAKRLWTDPVIRDATVKVAEQFVEKNKDDPRLTGEQQPSEDTVDPNPANEAGTSDLTSDPMTSDTPLTSDTPEAAAEPAAAPSANDPEAQSAEDQSREKLEEIKAFQSQLEELTLPMFPVVDLVKEYNEYKGEKPAVQIKDPWYHAPLAYPRIFFWWLGQHLLGFLLTGLAASLGAPFWFDVLNKFINLRSTGRKPDLPANVPTSVNQPVTNPVTNT